MGFSDRIITILNWTELAGCFDLWGIKTRLGEEPHEYSNCSSDWKGAWTCESNGRRGAAILQTVVQNQHTRDLISIWKTSHKHNNKDLSHLARGWILRTRGTFYEVFVVVFVWHLLNANYLPCVLILYERSETRGVSDCSKVRIVLYTLSNKMHIV